MNLGEAQGSWEASRENGRPFRAQRFLPTGRKVVQYYKPSLHGVQIPALPFPTWVTLDKPVHLSVPQFLLL